MIRTVSAVDCFMFILICNCSFSGLMLPFITKKYSNTAHTIVCDYAFLLALSSARIRFSYILHMMHAYLSFLYLQVAKYIFSVQNNCGFVCFFNSINFMKEITVVPAWQFCYIPLNSLESCHIHTPIL